MAKSFHERHQHDAKPVSEKNNREDRIKQYIKVEPVEMECLMKNKVLTSDELAGLINKLFGGIIVDYAGSRIVVKGNVVEAEIFLEETNAEPAKDSGQWKALVRRTEQEQKKGALGTIQRFNNRNKVATFYELTQDAKDAIGEFVDNEFINYNTKEVNWKKCTAEITERNIYGQAKIYYKINLDVKKIISKIYGRRLGEVEYEYLVGLVRPIYQVPDPSGSGNIITTKWLLTIQQLENKTLKEILAKAGMSFSGVNDLGIIRK